MTEPLALILYEKLLPGTQLVNRLQDLKYRVQTLSDASKLVETAEQASPMLVFADLESTKGDVCAAIAALKENPGTHHLPVVGISGENSAALEAAAQTAGATLIVNEATVLLQLPQILEQALRLD